MKPRMRYAFERGPWFVYPYRAIGQLVEFSLGVRPRERYAWLTVGLFGWALHVSYEDVYA